MQIIFQKEHEVDKIKEDVGFTVVKVVGDVLCELNFISLYLISNIDQQLIFVFENLLKTYKMPSRMTSKIATLQVKVLYLCYDLCPAHRLLF